MFKPGDAVSIKKTTLKGLVERYAVSEDGQTISYVVGYEEDGEKKSRHFEADQLVIEPK